MPACPAGHDSTTDDYCDVCGAAIADAPAVVPEDRTCAACGTPFTGRFCEECGHDSLSAAVAPPAPPQAPVAWHVVVTADRAYFDRVIAAGGPDADAVDFPPYCPERRFALRGAQVAIGRRSRSRGIFPEVDLIGPPEDPGVSASHALLVGGPSGWSIVDLASTNGTTVNDEPDALRPHQPRPVAEGDRIHLGAWTTLTIHRS
jgi:hypothetical protein